MKRKVFFIISSLKMGGAQRVYWLIAKYFNKSKYDVTLVVLDSNDALFPLKIEGVKTVELKTIRVSKSLFKLYKLIKKEQPYAIFTTGGALILGISLLSYLVKIPFLFARESNIPDQNVKFAKIKGKILSFLIAERCYKRFTKGICQSPEIFDSLLTKFKIPSNKLLIIPNPVEETTIIKSDGVNSTNQKNLILVGRLDPVKGITRLLKVMTELPSNYVLSIAGEGSMRAEISANIELMGLHNRVKLLGEVNDVLAVISKNDMIVLSSFTEGFPNVILESLSVGVPVVTFRVGGVSDIIINDFNGYIAEQDDLNSFKEYIIKAGDRKWDPVAIKDDILKRYSIDKTVSMYESLIG